MAENLSRRPKKSILKNSSSFDKQDSQISVKKAKETKWDEMNIIATLHPADKDYGHMKIEEPKTPYNYLNPDQIDGLNPEELADRMAKALDKPPKVLDSASEDDDSEEQDLTEEEKQRRKEFELKRKKHYNEFHALQLAKKLLEEEEEEDDAEDNKNQDAGQSSSSKKQ